MDFYKAMQAVEIGTKQVLGPHVHFDRNKKLGADYNYDTPAKANVFAKDIIKAVAAANNLAPDFVKLKDDYPPAKISGGVLEDLLDDLANRVVDATTPAK